MPHLPIQIFRRITLAVVAALFAGLALSSIASAEPFVTKTDYKVTVSGSYLHQWQYQTGDYPDPGAPWAKGKGKVTSAFKTKRPWNFYGAKYNEPIPGVGVPPFRLMTPGLGFTEARNRANSKISVNYVADCGGELGECDGDEKAGTETSDRKCSRPKSRIPFEYRYDEEGNFALLTLTFGSHKSMRQFCGKDFPGSSSINHLPKAIRIHRALDRISGLKKGGSFSVKESFEEGWIGDNADDEGDRDLAKCPSMGGKGTRHCWKTNVTFKVRRVK